MPTSTAVLVLADRPPSSHTVRVGRYEPWSWYVYGASDGGGPAPEMRRAFHNLRLALNIRLSKGPLEAVQIRTIVDALDRAAGEIERS